MAEVRAEASPLYYRLRLVQRVLPLVLAVTGIVYELFEHGALLQPYPPPGLLVEVLFYAVLGPLLIFLLLTWLLNRVGERDAAEARLAALYQVSRESASARGLDELQELALSLPERARLDGGAAVLIIQHAPDEPWLLAGTRGLDPSDITSLQAALATGEFPAGCLSNQPDAASLRIDCPLLRALAADLGRDTTGVISVSLSREPSRRAVLGIWPAEGSVVQPKVAETLDSMAAGLAVAFDRAKLRAHERTLLQQVGLDAVSQQLGLVPTLERIVEDIVAEHPIAAAAVYLLEDQGDRRKLICEVSWPRPDAGPYLASFALAAIRGPAQASHLLGALPLEDGSAAPRAGVFALPISSEGAEYGVLVLAGHATDWLPHRSVLGIVASMMALLIRNSELYALLESQAVVTERNHLAREVHDGVAQALGFFNVKVQEVQRLLGRGQVAEATIALQELRNGSQEVYEEVRQMIRDLSEAMVGEGGFATQLERLCCAFARRTGLTVSLDAGAEAMLPGDAQIELARVVQEALNNVQRHAHASQVTVRLSSGAGSVSLSIEDDGEGLPQDRQTGDHLGLQIMRERVESIGGYLEVVSRTGAGTCVTITVPSAPVEEGRREELWSEFVS